MAGLKKINTVAGTGNPVQMQDLNNLWEAVEALTLSKQGSQTITIISGFYYTSGVTGTPITAGVIALNGQAYYLKDGVATVGQFLYVQTVTREQRIYEDGVSRYFYDDFVVNASNSPDSTSLGQLIGQAIPSNIRSWKQLDLQNGSVGTAQLEEGAVTSSKLAFNSVSPNSLQNGAVTPRSLDSSMLEFGYLPTMLNIYVNENSNTARIDTNHNTFNIDRWLLSVEYIGPISSNAQILQIRLNVTKMSIVTSSAFTFFFQGLQDPQGVQWGAMNIFVLGTTAAADNWYITLGIRKDTAASKLTGSFDIFGLINRERL